MPAVKPFTEFCNRYGSKLIPETVKITHRFRVDLGAFPVVLKYFAKSNTDFQRAPGACFLLQFGLDLAVSLLRRLFAPGEGSPLPVLPAVEPQAHVKKPCAV